MEAEIDNLKKTIVENEEEYKKTIYNMEKKMLQDKVYSKYFIKILNFI